MKNLVASLCALLLFVALPAQRVSAQLLPPDMHPKFITELPDPAKIQVPLPRYLKFEMAQTTQDLGLYGGVAGAPVPLGAVTNVWGYGLEGKGVTYPGPTIVAYKYIPLWAKYENNLPMSHLLPVDPTLHMAEPAKTPGAGIPAVVHLHGGHTEAASDGLPESWYTPGFAQTGPTFVKPIHRYDNDQEGATLWYHDHALGITRLNTYAGLAGFYFLRDARELALMLLNVLPSGKYEREIVLQDRRFEPDGQLAFPSQFENDIEGITPPSSDWQAFPEATPSAVAEFFGDYIIVNSVAWPKLSVEPRKYRIRLLNGSDSRFYIVKFENNMEFLQIGTDDGLLPYPVVLTQLLIAPGERADLILNFEGMAQGTELTWLNLGPDEPFKGFDENGNLSDGDGGILPPSDPASTGLLMKFVVDQRLKRFPKSAKVDAQTNLRPAIDPLIPTAAGGPRKLALFEGRDEFGRLQPMLGTFEEGSLTWHQPTTESVMLNDVEEWEVYNATADAHPIHLHLVSFQIIDRQPVSISTTSRDQELHNTMSEGVYGVGFDIAGVEFTGVARPPEDNEKGWKDTAVMLPGEVTRVRAKFDREGEWVWHCHILSHEDHDMMRRFEVTAATAPLAKGDAGDGQIIDNLPTKYGLDQNYPNPFNPTTEIRFALPKDSHVSLKVYNSLGQEVQTLLDAEAPAGYHTARFDAGRIATGVYYYRLQAGNYVETRKMMLVK